MSASKQAMKQATTMLPMTASQLPDVLRFNMLELNEIPMLWGKPGIGKSAIINQFAESIDAQLIDVRLGQYDSVDLRGFPTTDEATRTAIWYPPNTLPFVGNAGFDKKKPIILFLDELSSAQPAVQAVAYQLLNDRAIGEHKLMPNVRIVAAGNRDNDRGATVRMSTPLANRLVHFDMQEDVDSVCLYFQKIKLPMVGIAFLQFRKTLLSTFDPTLPDKAWASPRTWEKAFKIIAHKTMPENIKLLSVAGAVGQGPAQEFFGFIDEWHKVVPVKTIIADPMKAPIPEEESMKYATAVNISGEMSVKNIKPLCQYLNRLEPTYAILAWNLAVKRDETIVSTEQFMEMSSKHKAVFINN